MTAPQRSSGVRQVEIIMALSLATDLGTGRPIERALSSALIGVRLGEALGLSDTELREVYYLSMLAYSGCTADTETSIQLFGEDVAAASTPPDPAKNSKGKLSSDR